MKKEKVNKPKSLKSMMDQGTGPKSAENPKQNLRELMDNGGDSPSCKMEVGGKKGVAKYMNQA